jgi:uncharacterized membrane protein
MQMPQAKYLKFMVRKIIYVVGIVILVTISSCYNDVEEELYPTTGNPTQCDTSNATYTTVQSILQNNCYSCHSGSAPSGNVNLEGYANVKSYADNGKLIGVITWAPGFPPMPQGGNKLNECDIAKIQSWINQGTLNN